MTTHAHVICFHHHEMPCHHIITEDIPFLGSILYYIKYIASLTSITVHEMVVDTTESLTANLSAISHDEVQMLRRTRLKKGLLGSDTVHLFNCVVKHLAVYLADLWLNPTDVVVPLHINWRNYYFYYIPQKNIFHTHAHHRHLR